MVTARLQLEQLVYVFAVSTRSQRSQRNWLMQEYCERLYVPEMGGDAAKSFPVIYVSRESWEESTTNRYFVLTLQASPFVTKLAQVRLFILNLTCQSTLEPFNSVEVITPASFYTLAYPSSLSSCSSAISSDPSPQQQH